MMLNAISSGLSAPIFQPAGSCFAVPMRFDMPAASTMTEIPRLFLCSHSSPTHHPLIRSILFSLSQDHVSIGSAPGLSAQGVID
jgi:hypothetical protein